MNTTDLIQTVKEVRNSIYLDRFVSQLDKNVSGYDLTHAMEQHGFSCDLETPMGRNGDAEPSIQGYTGIYIPYTLNVYQKVHPFGYSDKEMIFTTVGAVDVYIFTAFSDDSSKLNYLILIDDEFKAFEDFVQVDFICRSYPIVAKEDGWLYTVRMTTSVYEYERYTIPGRYENTVLNFGAMTYRARNRNMRYEIETGRWVNGDYWEKLEIVKAGGK